MTACETYTIHGVNGPVVTVKGGRGLAMMDMVHVGGESLVGEVVGVDGDVTTVQVYEDTAGLAPGQPVVSLGGPMSIQLGPGLLGNIFDGIARPLKALEKRTGPFLGRGFNLPALDQEKLWETAITVKVGDQVAPGTLYAQCQETSVILHRCLVPVGLTGTVTRTEPNGSYNVNATLVEVTDPNGQVHPLKLSQQWPIRTPAPWGSVCPSPVPSSPASGSSTPSSPSARGAPPPSPAPSARARP